MTTFKSARDYYSCLTHFWGVILACISLLYMLIKSIIVHTPMINRVAVFIFGVSLLMMYATSSYYHYFTGAPTSIQRLRKLDHAMIYVFIAGSYTPFCLHFMPAPHGLFFMIFIWSIALLGIGFKILWITAPRYLSTLLYLIMGWAIVFDLRSFQNMPTGCLVLLAAGGIFYSIGAIFYMCKRPRHPRFGFHEIFHIFVLLGSLSHIIAIIHYIL